MFKKLKCFQNKSQPQEQGILRFVSYCHYGNPALFLPKLAEKSKVR